MKCGRCRKETDIHIMSMFNTQDLCMDCKEKEEKHPRYEEACKAEMDAVRNGSFDFQGIGYHD